MAFMEPCAQTVSLAGQSLNCDSLTRVSNRAMKLEVAGCQQKPPETSRKLLLRAAVWPSLPCSVSTCPATWNE